MNRTQSRATASEKLAAAISLVVALALVTVLFGSCGGEDLTFPGTGLITATEVPTDTPIPTDTP